MTISRGQMNRQLYMGGGIMNAVPREGALLGGIKKAAKKFTKGVKDIAKSDLGKAALLYAGTAGLGALGAGAARSTTGFGGIFNPSNVMANLGAAGRNLGILKSVGDYGQVPTRTGPLAKFFDSPLSMLKGEGTKSNLGKLATLGAVSAFLTSQFGMTEEQAEEELARDPSPYLERYYRNLNPSATEEEVASFVTANTSEYAVGGRVGFDNGSPRIDRETIMDLLEQKEKFRDLDPNFIVPEPEQSPDATPIPEGMMINPLQTMEFRDANRNGIEDRREGIYLEKDFIPKKDPEEFDIDLFKKYFEETKKFREVPRKNKAKGTGDPQEGINSLKPLADEQASGGSILTLMDGTEVFIPTGAYKNGTLADIIYSSTKGDLLREDILGKMLFSKGGRSLAAIGGKMDTASDNAMQAAGIEGLPVRQNPKGVKELDLRDSGGFIPPVGIKEKEDDIPAMLSNNEFVFTADAVRGMGDGDVDLGAQRMYDMMKKLEAGGRV